MFHEWLVLLVSGWPRLPDWRLWQEGAVDQGQGGQGDQEVGDGPPVEQGAQSRHRDETQATEDQLHLGRDMEMGELTDPVGCGMELN